MVSTYVYLRCPICNRVAPLLERIVDGSPVLMDFGEGRLVARCCRRCLIEPWKAQREEDERMIAEAIGRSLAEGSADATDHMG